ncbi:MAG TPA: hypothetical protein VFH14_13340 [Gemmatimonadaceae bacterium]|nr:hypothetical protein [Gemmatimonadaceae bacterium]
MLLKIGITALLVVGWHFPTTFFAPGGPPYERGWLIWPFGRRTQPAIEALPGVIAPKAPPATGSPTIALIAAGLASFAFLVAIAGVWGFVVPPTWWQPMVVFAAAASGVLFTIYFSRLAIIPLVVDVIAVWLALSQSDALTQLATP